MREKKYRSILKALSWRITATITTTLIALFVTGHVAAAIKIGGIEVVIKILLYYVHERIWLASKFGLNKKDNHLNSKIDINSNQAT